MSCLAFGANEARLLGSVPVWTGYLYLEENSLTLDQEDVPIGRAILQVQSWVIWVLGESMSGSSKSATGSLVKQLKSAPFIEGRLTIVC